MTFAVLIASWRNSHILNRDRVMQSSSRPCVTHMRFSRPSNHAMLTTGSVSRVVVVQPASAITGLQSRLELPAMEEEQALYVILDLVPRPDLETHAESSTWRS